MINSVSESGVSFNKFEKPIFSLGLRTDGQTNKLFGVRPNINNNTHNYQFEVTFNRFINSDLEINNDLSDNFVVDNNEIELSSNKLLKVYDDSFKHCINVDGINNEIFIAEYIMDTTRYNIDLDNLKVIDRPLINGIKVVDEYPEIMEDNYDYIWFDEDNLIASNNNILVSLFTNLYGDSITKDLLISETSIVSEPLYWSYFAGLMNLSDDDINNSMLIFGLLKLTSDSFVSDNIFINRPKFIDETGIVSDIEGNHVCIVNGNQIKYYKIPTIESILTKQITNNNWLDVSGSLSGGLSYSAVTTDDIVTGNLCLLSTNISTSSSIDFSSGGIIVGVDNTTGTTLTSSDYGNLPTSYPYLVNISSTSIAKLIKSGDDRSALITYADTDDITYYTMSDRSITMTGQNQLFSDIGDYSTSVSGLIAFVNMYIGSSSNFIEYDTMGTYDNTIRGSFCNIIKTTANNFEFNNVDIISYVGISVTYTNNNNNNIVGGFCPNTDYCSFNNSSYKHYGYLIANSSLSTYYVKNLGGFVSSCNYSNIKNFTYNFTGYSLPSGSTYYISSIYRNAGGFISDLNYSTIDNLVVSITSNFYTERYSAGFVSNLINSSLINSTLSFNGAINFFNGYCGGCIYNVQNSTFTDNTITMGGSISGDPSTSTSIYNSYIGGCINSVNNSTVSTITLRYNLDHFHAASTSGIIMNSITNNSSISDLNINVTINSQGTNYLFYSATSAFIVYNINGSSLSNIEFNFVNNNYELTTQSIILIIGLYNSVIDNIIFKFKSLNGLNMKNDIKILSTVISGTTNITDHTTAVETDYDCRIKNIYYYIYGNITMNFNFLRFNENITNSYLDNINVYFNSNYSSNKYLRFYGAASLINSIMKNTNICVTGNLYIDQSYIFLLSSSSNYNYILENINLLFLGPVRFYRNTTYPIFANSGFDDNRGNIINNYNMYYNNYSGDAFVSGVSGLNSITNSDIYEISYPLSDSNKETIVENWSIDSTKPTLFFNSNFYTYNVIGSSITSGSYDSNNFITGLFCKDPNGDFFKLVNDVVTENIASNTSYGSITSSSSTVSDITYNVTLSTGSKLSELITNLSDLKTIADNESKDLIINFSSNSSIKKDNTAIDFKVYSSGDTQVTKPSTGVYIVDGSGSFTFGTSTISYTSTTISVDGVSVSNDDYKRITFSDGSSDYYYFLHGSLEIAPANVSSSSSSGDPHVYPLYGSIYELPTKVTAYRMLQGRNMILNLSTRKTTVQEERDIKNFYEFVKDEEAPINLISNGVFYHQLYLNVENHEIFFDYLEGKGVFRDDYFDINYKKEKPELMNNYEKSLDINQIEITFTHSIYGKMIVCINYFDNPQIKYGISINMVFNNEVNGLLIRECLVDSMELNDLFDNEYKYEIDGLNNNNSYFITVKS